MPIGRRVKFYWPGTFVEEKFPFRKIETQVEDEKVEKAAIFILSWKGGRSVERRKALTSLGVGVE